MTYDYQRIRIIDRVNVYLSVVTTVTLRRTKVAPSYNTPLAMNCSIWSLRGDKTSLSSSPPSGNSLNTRTLPAALFSLRTLASAAMESIQRPTDHFADTNTAVVVVTLSSSSVKYARTRK